MSNPVSLTLLEEVYASSSGVVPIWLLTLSHPDFAETLRICSSATVELSETPYIIGTISGGQTYYYLPMAVKSPDDVDDRGPTCEFVIANVGRDLIALVRSINTPGTLQLQMVRADDPDTPERDYPEMKMMGIQYDATTITVQAGLDIGTLTQVPAGTFAPSGFPGLR